MRGLMFKALLGRTGPRWSRGVRRWTAVMIAAGIAALVLPFAGRLTAADPPGLAATEQVRVLNSPFPNRNQLIINPTNPLVMYWAVAGLGVLKSTNRGVTWAPKNYGLPSLAARSIAMDPNDSNHLLIGFDGHTTSQGPWPYRSRDGGERWEPTVVCERQGKKENLRQQASSEKVIFDRQSPNWFYYLVSSQFDGCGGFYRSCDQGASYDRNPHCITLAESVSPEQFFQRPACAQGEPEPVNNIPTNDASIAEIDSQTGALFVTTGIHPEEGALMTSLNKGGSFSWQDVVDTTGSSFVPAVEQGPLSLYLNALALAPSDSGVRYGIVTTNVRVCADGRAHPTLGGCSFTPWPPTQPRLVVQWTNPPGEMTGGVECAGSNDCDGDPSPDRLWRPIFNGTNRPSLFEGRDLLVHPNQPQRLYVAGIGSPSELLMLTPSSPGAEWQATLIYGDSSKWFDRLVQDPGDADSFYLLARDRFSFTPSIHRFTPSGGYQTWLRTDVVTTSEFFHVNQLVETRGSAGPRIVAATSDGIRVADELGAAWSGPDVYHMHDAALAVDPGNPDRVFAKGAWPVKIGTSGFESLVGMDDVRDRRSVMCTNIFHGLVVDPDDSAILYAATGAGIWRHPNAHVPVDAADLTATGLAWRSYARASDGLADEYVWSLVFDPVRLDHNWMLAGTRSGAIYESFNRGDTWSAAPMNLPGSVSSLLKDVRDIQFAGFKAFAATGAGVLQRRRFNQAWTASLTGDRIVDLAKGATGLNRVYAAGDARLYRTRDAGASWESLPLVARPPFSAVLETTSRDGRHHLWVPDFRAGLYRVSTTLSSRPGPDTQSVVLQWTHSAGQPVPAGYELHYGEDPDGLNGHGATEGNSPILLGPVTSASLSGIDFSSGPVYVALKAVDAAQQRGPLSLPLLVDFGFTFSPAITAAPSSLCTTAVRLTWAAVPGAQGYGLYKRVKTPGSAFAPLVTLAAGQTTFDDTAVSAGTIYEYYATTLFAGGPTSGGNLATGTPPADTDLDGVRNTCDNCPFEYNPSQNFVGDPLVEVVAPNGGEELQVNGTATLEWWSFDSCGGVASLDLLLSRNGGGSFEILQSVAPGTESFEWTVTEPVTSQAIFKVMARDPAGNTGSDLSDAVFTIKKRCGPCQTEFCTGVEIGCTATGTCALDGCCHYQCGVFLPNCIDPTCPPNVCGGCGGF